MKTIGILTYHAVCNYGANLQALSTVCYFKARGYRPIVIDWVPPGLDRQYRATVPPAQYAEHERFVQDFLPLSKRCRTEDDILEAIDRDGVDAVVIGSDAVVQHKSLWARLHFPTKRVFRVSPPPAGHLLFPNPFWGCFASKLRPGLPTLMMSVSCQNEAYAGIQGSVRRQMNEAVAQLAYISVRDGWTQRMFRHISHGRLVPPVTPDPVFGFNENAKQLIPSMATLWSKYGIEGEYLLLSFVKPPCVDRFWLSDFCRLARERGLACLMLPMPRGHVFEPIEGIRQLQLPVSVLDWYGLIKYSSGYVGHNMHPMIVAMHNDVPFYSFDYYGVVHLRHFVNEKSSKIYDLLERSNLLGNRCRDAGRPCRAPGPEHVFDLVMSARERRSPHSAFRQSMQSEYLRMMEDIVRAITSPCNARH